MGFLMEAETQHSGVHSEVLGVERLVVVASPGHRLATAAKVERTTCGRSRCWPPRRAARSRELLEAELNDGTGEAALFLEFGNIEAIKRGVGAGRDRPAAADDGRSGAVGRKAGSACVGAALRAVHTAGLAQGANLSRERRVFVEQVIDFLSRDTRILTVPEIGKTLNSVGEQCDEREYCAFIDRRSR